MEYLDVVDENNILIGKKEERKKVHELGLFHREIVVIVVNELDQILIDKRASTKIQFPNLWEFCAGHVEANEDVVDTAIREVKEELGIDVKELELIDFRKIVKKFSDTQYNNYFQYTYLARTNKKISEVVLQSSENSEAKYISIDELKVILDKRDSNYVFTSDNYYGFVSNVLKEVEKRRINK